MIDPELISYDIHMQALHPGRPRSEYMSVEYPARILFEDETSLPGVALPNPN
jgi:hypothetical protein